MEMIHRDIKPENFLIGKGDRRKNMIFIMDFGLAKRYRDQRTGEHIPFRTRKGIVGTVRYNSINSHLGRGELDRSPLCCVLIAGRAEPERRPRGLVLYPRVLPQGVLAVVGLAREESG